MATTEARLNPWAGQRGRQRRRIYQELRHLGETRRWWVDACRFIQDGELETGAHMAFHALRELFGSLLDLLVPLAGTPQDPQYAKERERVAAVLAAEGFDREVINAAQNRLPPGSKEKIAGVCRMLGLGPEIEKAWGRLELHRAHRRNLGMRAVTDAEVTAAFNDAERVLAAVSERWAQHYPSWFALVDDIVSVGPEKDNVKRLLESVPAIYELRRRFFDSVEDPSWLTPLRAAGILSQVPSPELSDDETTIRYLPWPAEPFLVRTVEGQPSEVHRVLSDVSSTDNPLALHAIVLIAAGLPVELAVSLLPAIAGGVGRWRGLRRPPGLVGRLVSHLAANGAQEEALDLSRSVLSLTGAHHIGADNPQQYRELVIEVLQGLDALDQYSVIDMVVAVLAGASGGGADRSVVWLREVSETISLSDDNRTVLAKSLVHFVTPSVAAGDAETLRRLMGSGTPVAQRIALNLSRTHPAADPAVLFEDISSLGADELRIELGELVRDRWPDLGDGRGQYLKLVGAGPDIANLDRSEDADQVARRWRGYYLRPILDALDRADPDVAALLERAEVPEVDVLARPTLRVRFAEPRSPWSAEEMIALDIDELVAEFRAFTAGEGLHAATWRGVGETLAAVVAGDIDRYGRLPELIRDLPPEVLEGAIGGVARAARQHPIDWEVVVGAASIAAQWDGVSGGGWDGLDKPHTALRYQGLAAIRGRLRHNQPLPEEVTEPLLDVVRRCLGDEEPSDNEPGLDVGPIGNLHPTVRNEALATLVDIMAAVSRRRGDVDSVGRLLILSLENERNPYVFAEVASDVYQLMAFAPDWLAQHVENIFGPPGSSDARHLVAWEVLSYNEPEGMLAALLAPHYIAWVESLTSDPLDETGLLIAGHIGALGVSGDLPWPTLQRFFDTAAIDGRASALSYAAPATPDAVDRAQQLWEWRAQIVEADGEAEELGAITAWLGSGLLPNRWLLEQLDRATRAGAPLTRPDMVLMNLHKLASDAEPVMGELILDVLERVLAQAELHQLGWSTGTVVGIIDRVSGNRPDLAERVTRARATAALRLQDPSLHSGAG